MRLRTERNLMRLNLFISIIFASAYYSYAGKHKDNRPVKTMIVRDIMKKVSNITLNSLAHVPEDKKLLVLKKIERKLLKTAHGLENGDKYVQFIMQEFKNQAFNNNNKKSDHAFRHTLRERDRNKDTITITTVSTTTTTSTTTEMPEIENMPDRSRKIYDAETKQRLINDIARKIENTAKNYLKTSQTLEEKEQILAKIREKIEEKAKQRHAQIHNQHNELKMYSDLITKGFEVSLGRLLNQNSRRSNPYDTIGFDDRIIVPEKSEVQNSTVKTDSYVGQYNITDYMKQYQLYFSDIWKITDIDPHCAEVTEDICLRLDSLHKLSCGGEHFVTVLQLCDGVPNCLNEADETNCTEQAVDKIRKALSIMYDVDETVFKNCLPTLADHDVLSHHHHLLENMLVEQAHYMEKYTPFNSGQTPVYSESEKVVIKNSMSDLRSALNTLAYAFDSNLCTAHGDANKRLNNTRRNFKEISSSEEEVKWTPKLCSCKRQNCRKDDCDNRCRRICYQKHSLNHWECQSINGEMSISLNSICDGKLDCYDETDETLCTTVTSYTKYQANELYKEMLDILSLKILSMEYGNSRVKLAEQINIVRQLQKQTTMNTADSYAVKILRDEFFKILVQVYVDLMQTLNEHKLEQAYEFLLMISQKMISALKLSHTGNKSHLTPAGCFCHNGTCAIVRCSKKCILTCQLEPGLTRYSCNASNTSISIRDVCNGKKDCPNEDDEKDCSKEVCRSHHLYVLRHKLKGAGMSQRGTMVGETIAKWKDRVIATMLVSPLNERPTHKTIENIVMQILRDLVNSYASIEETRRSSHKGLAAEFRNISDIVKQTLKSCGQ